MFKPMVSPLLNIKQFCHWKFKKIKTKKKRKKKDWGALLTIVESPW